MLELQLGVENRNKNDHLDDELYCTINKKIRKVVVALLHHVYK